MLKALLRVLLGIIAVTLVLETPSVYAIFGTRIARRAIGARRAEQAVSTASANETDLRLKNRTAESADTEDADSPDIW